MLIANYNLSQNVLICDETECAESAESEESKQNMKCSIILTNHSKVSTCHWMPFYAVKGMKKGFSCLRENG